MKTIVAGSGRLVLVRLNPGDDLLLGIQEAVGREGVQNGLLLSGVGSLSSYHVHVVKTTNLPPGDTFYRGDGPYDILEVTGMVLQGRVHAHVTFSNIERALGGHLEEGCRVLTFAVVAILDLPGTDLANWDRVGPLDAD